MDNSFGNLRKCAGSNLICMKSLMNRMGELTTVEYEGENVKCLASCENQINSVSVASISYPSKRAFIHQKEFCTLAKRLVEKCKGPKRKPLEQIYPNMCLHIEPLKKMDLSNQCLVITFNQSQGRHYDGFLGFL